MSFISIAYSLIYYRIFDMIDMSMIALLACVFLLAGTVKGAAGLGLPTTSVGLMTLFLAPRTAIALILFPLVLTNAWQVYRSGQFWAAVKRYLSFILCLVGFVWLTVSLTSDVNDQIILAFLGVSILLFVGVNMTKISMSIPKRFDRIAQIIAGISAGVLGGLTSVWAPPLAIYLAARNTPKEEFVRASGLIFFLGSIPLILGYLKQGYLTPELSVISAMMLIPTFAGFWIGESIRHKMSEQAFRKFLLFIFLLMGLNLLRRAVFGG